MRPSATANPATAARVDPAARSGGRGVPGHRLHEPAIELRCRHAAVPHLGRGDDGAHQLVEALLTSGRHRNDGDARNLGEAVLHLGDELLQVFLLILDQVPLVEGNDEGAAFLCHEITDGEILMLERTLSINDEHNDLGEADGT